MEKIKKHSKKYLLENINLMKSFDKTVTLAEKRTNLYQLTKHGYDYMTL